MWAKTSVKILLQHCGKLLQQTAHWVHADGPHRGQLIVDALLMSANVKSISRQEQNAVRLQPQSVNFEL